MGDLKWTDPWRIALSFTLAGVLWIVLSDRVLVGLGLDPEIIAHAQTVKGILFVGATAVLLFVVLGLARSRRRELTRRLAKADERLETLLAHLPGVVYRRRFDPQWSPLYLSAGALEVTGHSAEDLREGRASFRELVHPRDRERVEQEWTRAGAAGSSFDVSYRLRHADGRERWVWDRGRSIERQGEVPLVEGVVLDATERKELEARLAQAQKMEAVGRLAGGVAHDFNNLLTAILGYTQLLLEETPVGGPSRRDLESIERAAQRAAALTRQLLAFSRRKEVDPQPLDLAALVGGVREMLGRLLGEDVDLVLELAPEALVCRADPGQLEQVLLNLVLNARDAMPAGGKLRISTRAGELERWSEGAPGPGGAFVELAVSDTGAGIPAAILPRLFEPFFTTKAAGEGTGLGLATALSMVEAAGGAIAVESEPGRGSTFRVRLPRSAQACVAQAVEPAQPLEERRGDRVLLVEDEDQVRRLIRVVLERMGCTVSETTSAEQALELVAAGDPPPDLVVSDVILPHRSGTELVEELRRGLPDLPALYVSGYPGDRLEHIELGLDRRTIFLAKPFTPRDLAQAVAELLAVAGVEPRDGPRVR